MAARLVRTVPAALIALLAAMSLVAVAAVAAAPASAATPDDYFYISAIGPAYGTHTFGCPGPDGLATDSAGNVYTTLPSGFAKFSAAGNLLCYYTGQPGRYTPSPGGYGIDVDGNGGVYYADSNAHLIAKLTPYGGGVNGSIYSMVNLYGHLDGNNNGISGSLNGQFNFPCDVAVDGNYLYVADCLNNRIQKFELSSYDNSAAWVASWGAGGGNGTSGSGNGEFLQPRGIAADHNGHLFITDAGNHRVQELKTDGTFVAKWGVSTPGSDPMYFNDPIGIDVDSLGNVYVTDFATTTSRVEKFRLDGGVYELASRFGSNGTDDSQFRFPMGVAVAPNGYLWVADTQNAKLKRFARDGTPPTVTPLAFPVGWTKTPGHPELSATDPTVAGQYTSGGVTIYYSMTGGAPWTQYGEPFAGLPEGDNAITYYAKDAVGNASTPNTAHVKVDKTVPVTTPSGVPAGWSSSNVTVTLTPSSDGFSPMTSTEYRLQGAPTWTTYGSPFTVSAEGTTDYEYRSTDSAGNVETAKPLTVKIDKTAPTTHVSGISTGWSKTPETATFTADDALSGMVGGLAATEYSIDHGVTWVPSESATVLATISREGPTELMYRSTDTVGNQEAPKRKTVSIDSVPPVPKALASKSVKHGKTVKLTYRVSDSSSPQVRVTIKVYKGHKLRKTLAVGLKNTGSNLTYSYKCKLPKGKYTWKVYATDLAGNKQKTPGSKTLTVK